MDESGFQLWWERTWREREEELTRAFGQSHPPGSPEGYVVSFSWDDWSLCVPGACAMVFPPEPGGGAVGRETRNDWLYLTHGLTQPAGPEAVVAGRKAGQSRSGYGWEFGIIVGEPAEWVPQLLKGLVTYTRTGEPLDEGHLFQLSYREEDGSLSPFEIFAKEREQAPDGASAVLLFWPYLLCRSTFMTETGKFGILIGTTITEDEYQAARATTSAHVLLLLCKAGIGQRSDPVRTSVLKDRQRAEEWRRIQTLDFQLAVKELNAGKGRWHLTSWSK
jgi:hypothetical protein